VAAAGAGGFEAGVGAFADELALELSQKLTVGCETTANSVVVPRRRGIVAGRHPSRCMQLVVGRAVGGPQRS
jgi:hypothetical protein